MRQAQVNRNTLETQIDVKVNLDGTGNAALDTGVPFLDHMLDQVARHGMIDLEIAAKGDLHIDAHHTVEDIGITLGQAFTQAIGDKKGLRRYGHAYVPLDEALSRVVVDLSGRPGMAFNVEFVRARIGEFDVDLINEFFQGFVNHAMVTCILTICPAATRIIRQKPYSRHLDVHCAWRSKPIPAPWIRSHPPKAPCSVLTSLIYTA